ncbi:MAG: cysteine rich repeat-containing protein [Alphaproteobacteria bacterium]
MGNGPVASACARDIARYCRRIRHGRGAVRSCLERRRWKLSRRCRRTLGNTGYGRRGGWGRGRGRGQGYGRGRNWR